ncbi:ABC transporter permease [Acidihalobacter prosperus]|uniref:Peptide ABC transporter permease n=1 Tax=Acidihalobacter prosperus TaxID=160660 RepID=A0A1A6C5C2_9GAMM|nr:ABC transporter permease [Acidihalobacter prosperus]OBS09745.1 peptide ABC transporter permease [Acidihalobacter prosperus]
MAVYIVRRLLLLCVTLAAASALIFALTGVLPGSIGRIMLGPFASQHAVDVLNRQLGASLPLWERYLHWLDGLAHGDWGRSLVYDTPVLPLVLDRLKHSLVLAAAGLALLLPSAIASGVYAALREGHAFDRIVSVLSLSFGAIPEFVTGVVLIVVFGITLHWLPIQAMPAAGAGTLDWLRHLIMPAVALALTLFSYVFRMARSGMIEALAADYTRTAILKGLPRRVVLWRHVLRNALLPTITVVGAQIGWMVGGLVVVETLFRYPGIGSLTYSAATNKDIPLLVGCSLMITLVFALSNFLADLIHALLDPRARHAIARPV